MNYKYDVCGGGNGELWKIKTRKTQKHCKNMPKVVKWITNMMYVEGGMVNFEIKKEQLLKHIKLCLK